MQHIRISRFKSASFVACLGMLLAGGAAAAGDASAAARPGELNLWDGDWHFALTPYAWVPWFYTTVQLPAAAGGGTKETTTQPSQYLKYAQGVAEIQGMARKGDWSLWTDFLYFNFNVGNSTTRRIGLPGGSATLPVILTTDSSAKAVVWTLAPSYTVMNNDVGTLDVLAGIRYTDIWLQIAYNFTAPPTPLNQGGGFWPKDTSTAAIVGVRGALRLSPDGKWTVPYEANVGDGDKGWQYDLVLGVGYHFHWGDITLAARDLVYNVSGSNIEKVRLTGPVVGATFRW